MRCLAASKTDKGLLSLLRSLSPASRIAGILPEPHTSRLLLHPPPPPPPPSRPPNPPPPRSLPTDSPWPPPFQVTQSPLLPVRSGRTHLDSLQVLPIVL